MVDPALSAGLKRRPLGGSRRWGGFPTQVKAQPGAARARLGCPWSCRTSPHSTGRRTPPSCTTPPTTPHRAGCVARRCVGQKGSEGEGGTAGVRCWKGRGGVGSGGALHKLRGRCEEGRGLDKRAGAPTVERNKRQVGVATLAEALGRCSGRGPLTGDAIGPHGHGYPPMMQGPFRGSTACRRHRRTTAPRQKPSTGGRHLGAQQAALPRVAPAAPVLAAPN
jgi:hypothetical protein